MTNDYWTVVFLVFHGEFSGRSDQILCESGHSSTTILAVSGWSDITQLATGTVVVPPRFCLVLDRYGDRIPKKITLILRCTSTWNPVLIIPPRNASACDEINSIICSLRTHFSWFDSIKMTQAQDIQDIFQSLLLPVKSPINSLLKWPRVCCSGNGPRRSMI